MDMMEGNDLTRKRAYFVGVDLGQAHDPTAVSVVERETCAVTVGTDLRVAARLDLRLPRPQYRIRHLERLPLGMDYPAQVAHVVGLLCRDPLASTQARTYIDYTGVGRGVYDLFKLTRMPRLHPVTITSGRDVTRDDGGWHVPKVELISKVQALLHSRELTIEPELADAAALVRELQDFRVNYSTAGNAIFGARVGAHDDLVLSVSMAIFGATRSEPVMDTGIQWIPGRGIVAA